MLALAALVALAQDPDELPPIVRMPELVDFVQAPYPPEAEAAGIEGAVLLLLEIDETGAVTRAEVLEPAGHGFDEAAVEAARAFRFTPAEDENGPVAVALEFTYGFELAPAPEPETPVELPVNLEGALREMATRAPIRRAVIQVIQGEAIVGEARSDDEGRFSVRGVPPGRVAVIARMSGYEDQSAFVEVVEGEVTDVTLWLRNTDYRENEAVGVYEREREPEVTRRTISMAEVRRVPGTFGDPVRVIQSLPGAARAPLATGLLILRGANPEDSNVYVDGVEVPLVYHLGGFRSIINPDLIDAVDYLPGTYSARYGRSTGGVVEVHTQEEYPERPHLTWRTDVLDSGLYGEGRAGNFGWAAGIRRSYLDAILGAVLANQEFYAAPRWFDYQVKVQALKGADVSLLVFGFQDELIVRTDRDSEDELGVGYSTHRALLRWKQPLGERLALELRPAVGVDGTRLGFGSAIELDLDSVLVDLRGDLTWTPSDAVEVEFGLDAEASRQDLAIRVGSVPVDADDPLSETETLGAELDLWQLTPDPYAQATLRPLGERLTLVGGLRLDVLSRTDEPVRAAVEPRGAARLEVVDGATLKAGSGLYHQPIAGVDLGLGSTVAFERAWSSELGWEQELGPAVRADVTGYYRQMDPLAVGGFGGGGVGIGRAFGAELMVRHLPVGRFFGWLSYTLSRSERNDTPGDPEGWYSFDFDQTHIATAVAGYRLPLDFEVSGRFQYVTGNPYTPYAGGLYQMDQGSYFGIPSAETNGARMPPFYALDLRASKLFTFKHWQLEVFSDVLNAVRGQNPEFVLYNYDYTESAFIRGLPLIPSIGFQAEVNL